MYDVDVRATLNAPMFKHEKINVFVWHGKREPWPIFSVDFELKISTKHTAYILSVALKTERKKMASSTKYISMHRIRRSLV